MVDEILDSVREVLESGWLTMGPKVQLVEQTYSQLLKHNHVIAMNSCTAALHIALRIAGIKKGSEVILPSNTFVATANSVLYNSGTPVFAEIQPDTMNLNPDDVENRISKNTRAIIVVHVAGLPCDMNAFVKIARDNDLILIEDCAHAHGSMLDGKACGTFGDYSCFSFYPTKTISGAEGGLLIAPDDDSESIARILLNHGRRGFGPEAITEIGYNYRMNELQAAVIIPQLSQLNEIVKKRIALAGKYNSELSDVDGIELLKCPSNVRHSYYSYMVKLPVGSRTRIMKSLLNEGVETSIMYHPIHLCSVYRSKFGFSPGDFPITEESCSRIVSLPLHLGLTVKQIEFVCNLLRRELE